MLLENKRPEPRQMALQTAKIFPVRLSLLLRGTLPAAAGWLTTGGLN